MFFMVTACPRLFRHFRQSSVLSLYDSPYKSIKPKEI